MILTGTSTHVPVHRQIISNHFAIHTLSNQSYHLVPTFGATTAGFGTRALQQRVNIWTCVKKTDQIQMQTFFNFKGRSSD